MNLGFSGQIFEEYSNIKFRENLSSGSRFVPHGRTDMKMLLVSFCNFSKAPKIRLFPSAVLAGWSVMEVQCILCCSTWIFRCRSDRVNFYVMRREVAEIGLESHRGWMFSFLGRLSGLYWYSFMDVVNTATLSPVCVCVCVIDLNIQLE
jgi:hypothetical protein